MKRFPFVVGMLLVALVAFARPERNSYLESRANTVRQLVHQIETKPVVARRYMRHFSMTKKELIKYFKSLYKDRLSQNMPVVMYSVPQGDFIKSHRCTLKKGAYVFFDRRQKLVLRLICGNPIKPIGESAFTLYPKAEAQIGQPAGPASIAGNEVAASAPAGVPSDALVLTSQPPLLTSPEDPPLITSTPTPDTMPVVPSGVPGVALPTNSNFDWALLPALGGLVSIGGGGGGGSRVQPPPAVPELPSVLVLALPAASLLLMRRRKLISAK